MVSLLWSVEDPVEAETTKVAPPRHKLSSPWMIRLAYASLLAVIALVSVVTYETWTRAHVWNPLGEYPVQTLLNADGTYPIGTPTYYLDDDITVQGKKCSDASEPVRILGQMTWVSDEPPGSLVSLGETAGTRYPGCAQMTYSNPIPTDVRLRINQLMARGVEQSTWHMAGIETPVRDDEKGEQRSWVTPSFVVVHRNRGA